MAVGLIEGYDMKLVTPDYFPGAGWYRAVVELKDDITDVLPYLNAELEGADYTPEAMVLLWKSGGRKFAFRPHEISVAPVETRDEAVEAVDAIVGSVNDIWTRRDTIEPNLEGKKPLLNILDIYRILPKTNCGECGSPSCMAFAAALRDDPGKLQSCSHISERDYHDLKI